MGEDFNYFDKEEGMSDLQGEDLFFRQEAGRSFYRHLLIGGLIGGGVSGFLINKIYESYYGTWPNVILTGLGFLIFAAMVSLISVLIEKSRVCFSRSIDSESGILLAGGLVLIFVLAVLLQFIYGLGGARTLVSFDSYIFLVDDSSSNLDTDPQNKRYEALKELIDKLPNDKKVGLLRFSEKVDSHTELLELNSENRRRLDEFIGKEPSMGGTDIGIAITEGVNIYKGSFGEEEAVNMILLSDGFSEINKRKIFGACMQNNIILNTVHFGPEASLGGDMKEIATATGGSYYTVDNVEELKDAYTKVVYVNTIRNLLDVRPGRKSLNVGYMVMRVLFVGILGALSSLLSLFVLKQHEDNQQQFLVSPGTGIAGGLLLELGLLNFINGGFLRQVIFPVMGMLILYYKIYKDRDYSFRSSGNDNFGYEGESNMFSNDSRDDHSSMFKD